ncbi:MAG: Arm DNA-binding domain-containing protein, partial [Acidobacteriota bacterium]
MTDPALLCFVPSWRCSPSCRSSPAWSSQPEGLHRLLSISTPSDCTSGLDDTRDNRRRAKALLAVIQGEIALGTFDYRKHFPNGARLADFYPDEPTEEQIRIPLVRDYLDAWHKRRSPFLPDGKVAHGADIHPSTWMHDESVIRVHLKPAFGE